MTITLAHLREQKDTAHVEGLSLRELCLSWDLGEGRRKEDRACMHVLQALAAMHGTALDTFTA